MPKFNTPVDLQKSELRNAVIQNLASAPASPLEGLIYYDTVGHAINVYENGSWQALSSSGSIPQATASVFGTIELGGDLAGTGSTAAAPIITAGTVGFSKMSAAANQWHSSVRLVAVANVNIASAPTTIDSITLGANNAILLTAQTTTSQNGIWLFASAGTPLTRPGDQASGTTQGSTMFIYVKQGTVYADTLWHCTNNGTWVVDTDATTWSNSLNMVGTLAAGATTITGNLGVAGNITTTSGGTITSAGQLTVSSGGAAITGTTTVTGALSTSGASGTITSAQALTVTTGGAAITGTSTVAGAFSTTGGSGTITSAQALTVTTGGASITGTTTVTGALSTSGASGTITSAQGLTVTTGGATVTGNSSINGTLNMNTHLINNVTNPVSAQDAATKAYVDNVAQGLSVKPSAVAATTASSAFTIASGSVTVITGTTVDGVSPAIGDRILVKDAPSASGAGSANSLQPGNGLYTVTNATTNLTISRDVTMDDANDTAAGAFVFVEGGTANAASGWVVSNPSTSAAFTYGTTSMQWTQFSGAGEITAGTGLSKSGNTLSIENSGILLPAHGGTGAASLAAHSVIVAEGASAAVGVAPSATTGVALVSAGSSADPSFGQLNVASSSAVTGLLALANGGTNASSAAAARTSLVTGSIYTTTFTGNGVLTSFTVTPTPTPVLTGAWQVTIINQTTGAIEYCDVTINQSTSVITITFTNAVPNALVYSVVVHG